MSNLTRKIMTTREIELIKASADFINAWKREFEKTGRAIDRLIKAFKRININKSPKYYRTGITPKWSNRTRKKQRLTRLQRRWKRQRR